MRPREVLLLTLRPLMVAGVIITGFATSAFCEDGDSGKAAYEASCAACHGQSGKGDGPAGAELRAKPPNLTSMAKRNGGIFPTEIVMERGRAEPMATMRCPFGAPYSAPNQRMSFDAAFWRSSAICKPSRSNEHRRCRNLPLGRPRMTLGPALACVALAVAGCVFGLSCGVLPIDAAQAQSTQPSPVERARTTVETLINRLRGRDMPAGIEKANGNIEATQVDLAAKYSGRVRP